jgi:hypothetical protein
MPGLIEARVVVFVDLTGSTRETQKRGAWRVESEIAARLDEIELAFKTGDPSARRYNSAGDGFLMIGEDPVALLVAALLEQGRWTALRRGLPARIAIGQGPIVWHGEPWVSDARGEIINFTARLLNVCPTGSVVLSDSVKESVQDRPEVRGRLQRTEDHFKGIGERTYWVINTGGEEMLTMLGRLARTDFALKTLITVLITVALGSTAWAWSVSWGVSQGAVQRLISIEIENAKRDARVTIVEQKVSRIDENVKLLVDMTQGGHPFTGAKPPRPAELGH